MSKRYVLGLMASNRPGVLAAVTQALGELGGNMYEASVTVVGQFFTMTLQSEFPDHRDPDVIVNHIRGVCAPFGVDVVLKDPTAEELDNDFHIPSQSFVLTLLGDDKPGLLAKVSSRMARDGIDIADFYAVRTAPTLSAYMWLELKIPEGVDVEKLRSDLDEIGQPFKLQATLLSEQEFITSDLARSIRYYARHQLRGGEAP